MPNIQASNEIYQQFLRRTPIKLRQFSRLLGDMSTQKIDPLRVKALLSQVNKTREACVLQEFDSTAKLLNQVFKQLSLSEETLDTQKPLLKRLSRKLQEHTDKFELGARPQKSTTLEMVAEIAPVSQNQAEVNKGQLDTHPNTDATKNDRPTELAVSSETTAAVQAELTSLPDGEVTRPEVKTEGSEETDETLDQDDSISRSLEEQGIYLDKGVIIFVSQKGKRYEEMSRQFDSLGVEVHHVTDLSQAKQHAIDNPGSIIVAPLRLSENNEQLEDAEIEVNRIPLIFTADEDNQDDRLLALRSGGTGYLVEPVSISALLGLIERQYDIHADSPYRVLVMEDSKAQAKFYEKTLAKGHFETRLVVNPAVFLEALREFDPEIILMDMQMPGCSGIELTRIIRQMPRYAFLPIIFLSAEESARKQNQALLSGGTSFMVKPAQKEQLMFLVELYGRRYRGLNPQIDVNPDTGLTFSPQFKQQIAVEASRINRSSGNAALAIIQLDEIAPLIANANFSLINVATQQLSLLLKQRLRKSDIMGHLGSGQIGVILTTGNKQHWSVIMDEIRLHFAELPFHLQHQDKTLTISIGIAQLSANSDAHEWYEKTTSSLDKAMENGGDQTILFEPQ